MKSKQQIFPRKLLSCLLGVMVCFAIQPLKSQNVQWVNAFGASGDDAAYGVFITEGGAVYSTGYFTGSVDFSHDHFNVLTAVGERDAFLQKCDTSGDIQWTIAWGGIGKDLGNTVKCDASENVYVIGEFEDSVDFDPGNDTAIAISNGLIDIYVAKYSPDGDLMWQQTFGGDLDDYGYYVQPSGDKIYLSGSFGGTMALHNATNDTLYSNGKQDVFVICLDTAGTVLWGKSIGGPSTDIAFDIEVNMDRELFLVGQYNSKVDFDPESDTAFSSAVGFSDAFLLKLDSVGTYVWHKVIEGWDFEAGSAVKVDSKGNIYMAGLFTGADLDPGPDTLEVDAIGIFDMFFLKLNPAGDLVWVRTKGVPGWDVPQSLDLDNKGNLYVCGNYRPVGKDEIVVYKYDSTGTPVWSYKPDPGGGPNIAVRMQVLRNDEFIICGSYSDTLDFNSYQTNDPIVKVSNGQLDGFVTRVKVESVNTAINDLSSTEVYVFPNPTKDVLNILFSSTAQKHIELFDLNGRRMLSKSTSAQTEMLDLSKYPSGLYQLVVYGFGNELFIQRIVVE